MGDHHEKRVAHSSFLTKFERFSETLAYKFRGSFGIKFQKPPKFSKKKKKKKTKIIKTMESSL